MYLYAEEYGLPSMSVKTTPKFEIRTYLVPRLFLVRPGNEASEPVIYIYNLELLISRLLIRYAQLLFRTRACGSTNAKGQSAKILLQNKTQQTSFPIIYCDLGTRQCNKMSIQYSSYVTMSTRVVRLPC